MLVAVKLREATVWLNSQDFQSLQARGEELGYLRLCFQKLPFVFVPNGCQIALEHIESRKLFSETCACHGVNKRHDIWQVQDIPVVSARFAMI